MNWNAKSKIGSLENKDHKPGMCNSAQRKFNSILQMRRFAKAFFLCLLGGGDKKIINFGTAKPKVGSNDIADKQSPETVQSANQ